MLDTSQKLILASRRSINAPSVPDNCLPSLVFQVTTPNAFYQPPIKAEMWSSSVLTAKPPSALKEVLVSTNEENILLNTKPTRMCREPKNSGAKKSSHSWLNVRPLFLHTSQIATSFYNHTSLIAQLKVSKGERYRQLLQTAKEKLDQEPLLDEPPVNNNPPSEQQPEVNLDSNNMSTTNPTANSTFNQDNSTSIQEDSFQSLLQNLSTQVNPNLSSIIQGHLNSRDINQDLEHYLTSNFSGTPPVCPTIPTQPPKLIHATAAEKSNASSTQDINGSSQPTKRGLLMSC